MNKVFNENCLTTMDYMNDNIIDLVLTSPPYDNLRNYKGYCFPFEQIAMGLYRVLKPGGVIVWVVGDQTINGSESGTSFKQALFFKSVGFNIHDTMIYHKRNSLPLNHNRYEQDFEYMFILSKGKPAAFNPIIIPTTSNEKRDSVVRRNNPTETKSRLRHGAKRKDTKPTKIKGNIWTYNTGMHHTTSDKIAFLHPATFPEQLAADHILSWSNEGDLVYDPFIGSGTVAKMAKQLNRNYIGSEISAEYCAIIHERLNLKTA